MSTAGEGPTNNEESGNASSKDAALFNLPDPDDTLFDKDFAASPSTEQYDELAEAIREADAAGPVDQTLSVHVEGVGIGVVGFDDMTGEDSETGVVASEVEDDEQTAEIKAELEAKAKRRRDLQTRVATGLGLVGLIGLAAWAGGAWFVGLVGVLLFLALGEYYSTARRSGFTPIALIGLLSGVLVFVFGWSHGVFGIATTAIFSVVVLLLYYAIVPRQRPFENMSVTALGFLWISTTAAFVAPLAKMENWQQLILFIVLAVAAGDSGAFLVGRWLGRTRFAPVLSPNKTVEGLIGGVVAALAIAVGLTLVPWFSDAVTMTIALWTAAVVSVIAPFGDLVESMVKRSLGVKDMGNILPGHGGILDRVDSFLLVLPAIYAAYLWLGLLG